MMTPEQTARIKLLEGRIGVYTKEISKCAKDKDKPRGLAWIESMMRAQDEIKSIKMKYKTSINGTAHNMTPDFTDTVECECCGEDRLCIEETCDDCLNQENES